MELIGYHTESGDEKITKVLPYVEYSKFLLNEAIRENKTTIVGRGVTKWLGIFPSLSNYDNCFFLASNRGVSLSKSTISPTAYKNITKAAGCK